MKQETDSDQIFDRLDQLLRKNERKQKASSDVPLSNVEAVPRVILTEDMRTDTITQTTPSPQTVSLEHITLDSDEIEELVAQVYADVNARIDEVITDWIDESLQQRVLEITRKHTIDEPLSH